MKTAAEMRLITIPNKKARSEQFVERKMEQVESAAEKRAKQGFTSCTLDVGSSHHEYSEDRILLKERLLSLGYTVIFQHIDGRTLMQVDW